MLTAVLSPIWLAVLLIMGSAMVLRPEDRGRWLYREPRISRGREFDLLKFRVLREDVLVELNRSHWHAMLGEVDAANLTWSGRHVLKPWYLDELPQLLNILKGDMSLVGPRPWPPSLVRQQVAQGYPYRNLVRAGLTGPVQITKGRPETGGTPLVDLEYVQACRRLTGPRDLGILLRTISVVWRGEGLEY
jgi:lipopolysaccharide/colanic/teichoic acid biosynthesis glycosyltransferase